MDSFLKGYIAAALWSSNDESTPEGGEPFLDSNYGPEDIAPETLARMKADCDAFRALCDGCITEENITRANDDVDSSAGHDFWLTRNHHGAGFWDGDWKEPAASRLTEAAHSFGEVTLYVGDDNKIHAY